MLAYNIHATCDIGPIVSRRVVAQRAVKQARDYRRLGYANIWIVDVLTGQQFDTQTLAAMLQAAGPGKPVTNLN